MSVFSRLFIFFSIWIAGPGHAADLPLGRPDTASREPTQEWTGLRTDSDDIETLIKKMPLRTKIGQLFIFGFMGEKVESGLGTVIQKMRPGALVVFSRNIRTARQIADLNAQAQQASMRAAGVPLLIAVDQEGGNVVRIKTAASLPSALALAETKDQKILTDAGLGTGRLLHTLGFNMNLAPVLDVANPNEDVFIGTRTFGAEPKSVTESTESFADGLRRAGILPTAKHFPGHGGIREDSHLMTPMKVVPLEDMWVHDLLPFRHVAQNSEDWAMMIAHIAYPMLDPTSTPATFSKPIVQDLLRGKLAFKGLVISDDIEMAGAFAVKDVRERALRAIEAGVDMIMVAWNKRLQYELVEALHQAVASHRLSEERIDESLRRILSYKKRFVGFKNTPSADNKTLLSALQNPVLTEVSEKTLAAQFIRQRKSPAIAAIAERGLATPVLIFTAYDIFYRNFRDELPGRGLRYYPLAKMTAAKIEAALKQYPSSPAVFYVSGTHSARIANQISRQAAARVLLINTETRSLLSRPQDFQQIVDVYFRHPLIGKFAAKYFFKAQTVAAAVKQPAKE